MNQDHPSFATSSRSYRGYEITLTAAAEWTAAISRPGGGGLATTTSSSLAEGPDACVARAAQIIDTYLTYLLDVADGTTSHDAAEFEAAVRDTAYFLWEQDGRPEDRADMYWERALDQHIRARAYSSWLAQDDPSPWGR